jgi:DNA-binding transcriptional LysR family regulator
VRLTQPFRFVVVGGPAYLARNDRPVRPDDLRHHACVRLRRSNGALALWSLNDNGRALEIAVSGSLIANDFPTMLGAAVEGLGLTQVPRQMMPKLRAFIDHVKSRSGTASKARTQIDDRRTKRR